MLRYFRDVTYSRASFCHTENLFSVFNNRSAHSSRTPDEPMDVALVVSPPRQALSVAFI